MEETFEKSGHLSCYLCCCLIYWSATDTSQKKPGTVDRADLSYTKISVMTAAKLFWMFTSTAGSKSHSRALIFVQISLSTTERQMIDI